MPKWHGIEGDTVFGGPVLGVLLYLNNCFLDNVNKYDRLGFYRGFRESKRLESPTSKIDFLRDCVEFALFIDRIRPSTVKSSRSVPTITVIGIY